MRTRNTGWQPKTYTAKTYTPHVYPKILSLQDAYNNSRHPIVITNGRHGTFSIKKESGVIVDEGWAEVGDVIIYGGDARGNDPIWIDHDVLLVGGVK